MLLFPLLAITTFKTNPEHQGEETILHYQKLKLNQSSTCACEMHFMPHLLPKWDVKAVHNSFTFLLFYKTAQTQFAEMRSSPWVLSLDLMYVARFSLLRKQEENLIKMNICLVSSLIYSYFLYKHLADLPCKSMQSATCISKMLNSDTAINFPVHRTVTRVLWQLVRTFFWWL